MGDVNYLGQYALGKIQKWQDSKAATITPISFPGKDAGNTEAIDTLGIIAYINISGRLTGRFQSIQLTINGLKGIADGMQTSSQVFKSPFVNGIDFASVRRIGTMGSITTTTTNKCVDSQATFSFNGIKIGDVIKNLDTGDSAFVSAVDLENQLSLVTSYLGAVPANIFTSIGQSYAVSASINVKLLSIEVNWELPGLTYCDYTISVIQVA